MSHIYSNLLYHNVLVVSFLISVAVQYILVSYFGSDGWLLFLSVESNVRLGWSHCCYRCCCCCYCKLTPLQFILHTRARRRPPHHLLSFRSVRTAVVTTPFRLASALIPILGSNVLAVAVGVRAVRILTVRLVEPHARLVELTTRSSTSSGATPSVLAPPVAEQLFQVIP